MKKFLIIYLHKGARFFCQHEALGLFDAVHKFEATQKLNADQIISIDVL